MALYVGRIFHENAVENLRTDAWFLKVSVKASQVFRAPRVGWFFGRFVPFFRDVHDDGSSGSLSGSTKREYDGQHCR